MDDQKYLGKYRVPSARYKGWDYRRPAHYFITICTTNRQHFFGEIPLDKMIISPVGAIAHVLWHEMIHHYPKGYVELGEFVVMPNHVHGIITLNNNVETQHAASIYYEPQNSLLIDESFNNELINRESYDSINPESHDSGNETQHAASLHESDFESESKSETKTIPNITANSISSMVRNYKSAVTKYARRLGFSDFAWQSRFYDHIIRNEESYHTISNYIINNPMNWNKDKFYQ